MSERSKFANEPLMYIHQPTQGKPSAPMQHFYTTPKNSTTSASTPESKKKTTQSHIKKRPSINSFQNSVAENPQVKESKQNSPEQEKAPIQSPKKRRTSLSSFHNDEAEQVKEIKPTETNSSQNIKERENKKNFKDMTIQEKIDYFLNSSSHLPRMRCEVLTEERKYRGIILEFEGNEVRMRAGRRTVYIKKEDIEDIQLLGLGY